MVTGTMDRDANSSKLRNIIASAVIAAAAGAGGYMIGKGNAPAAAPATKIEVEPAAPAAPAMVDVALDRADIIRLANEAADAASGGPAIVDRLEGRRFTIRIPIGCGANAPGSATSPASYSIENDVLRITIQPQDWTALPWILRESERRQLAAAEGFWIPRPWTRSDSCPDLAKASATIAPEPEPTKIARTRQDEPVEPVKPAAPAAAPSGLGIAVLYDSDSSRVGQIRGRALKATVPVNPANPDAGKALTLVLTGRVARWPGGSETVLCNARGPFDRPTCLVGAELDSIAIENAAGARLADWQL